LNILNHTVQSSKNFKLIINVKKTKCVQRCVCKNAIFVNTIKTAEVLGPVNLAIFEDIVNDAQRISK
jgi:hypothetical protein